MADFKWLTRSFVILAIMIGCWSVQTALAQTPPLPTRPPPIGDCAVDNIYYGAVPPNGEARRVLVFVHGLGGRASDWWSPSGPGQPSNDMYTVAYNAGYRTAFVDLTINLLNPNNCAVARVPGNSVREDGATLGKQIDAIRAHYGTAKVDLIGHSKGGVVAQAAIVFNNAAPKVRDVFTLDSPHQGSLVADYAISTGVYSDAAVFSLQHSVMAQFRRVIDASPLNAGVGYFYGQGTICSAGDLTKCTDGAEYLYQQPPPWGGANDGTITAAEAVLTTPGAQLLFRQPWSHQEASTGLAFPFIQRVLLSEQTHVYLPLVLSALP